MLPDLPNRPNPRAFWFKRVDAELAMTRLARHNRAEPKRISWAGVKRTFSTWVVYFVAILYISTVLASYGYVYFSLFLKSLKSPDGTKRWSVEQVNVIPIGGGAINVLFVWIWALLSDTLRTRWTLIVTQALIGLVPCITMSIWTSHPNATPLSAAYASYFISYLALGTAPLIFAWLSDLIPQDPEARSLIVGVAVAGYYAVSAWSQVLVWPASQAPYYKYGWQSCIALWVLVIAMTCTLRYVDVRYLLSVLSQLILSAALTLIIDPNAEPSKPRCMVKSRRGRQMLQVWTEWIVKRLSKMEVLQRASRRSTRIRIELCYDNHPALA